MVERGVQCLDAWHSDARLFCKLQWGSEIRLNLHGPPRLVIHPHCTVVLLRSGHFLQGGFAEVGRKGARLCLGQCDHLVEHAGNESAHTDLFDQFGVVCRLKKDAGRMESDWSILVSKAVSRVP